MLAVGTEYVEDENQRAGVLRRTRQATPDTAVPGGRCGQEIGATSTSILQRRDEASLACFARWCHRRCRYRHRRPIERRYLPLRQGGRITLTPLIASLPLPPISRYLTGEWMSWQLASDKSPGSVGSSSCISMSSQAASRFLFSRARQKVKMTDDERVITDDGAPRGWCDADSSTSRSA